MRLPVEQIQKLLRYDPETGVLLRFPHWKPVSLRAKGAAYATLELGGARYAARRVVWALMTGEWPPAKNHTIRVRNGDPFDLRWNNLYVLPDGHSQCSLCRQILPASEFVRRVAKPDRPMRNASGYCRECRTLARQRRPDYNHRVVVRKYGLTEAAYAALLAEQNGACAICKTPPTTKRLAVDHCHTSGQVRGLLCSPCNVSLGQFKDDPRLLLGAAKYILRHKGSGGAA